MSTLRIHNPDAASAPDLCLSAGLAIAIEVGEKGQIDGHPLALAALFDAASEVCGSDARVFCRLRKLVDWYRKEAKLLAASADDAE